VTIIFFIIGDAAFTVVPCDISIFAILGLTKKLSQSSQNVPEILKI